MTGVDSVVELVEVVEHPHSTVDNNIDHKEANGDIGDITLFHDLPHTTDNKPIFGTTIEADGIRRSHRNKATHELYSADFTSKQYGDMTGTANMNLNHHHRQYNLDGRIKAAQESRVNVDDINQRLVHILMFQTPLI